MCLLAFVSSVIHRFYSVPALLQSPQGSPVQIHCRSDFFRIELHKQYSPNTRIFFPDGNFELELVETSLSIEDLQETTGHRQMYGI